MGHIDYVKYGLKNGTIDLLKDSRDYCAMVASRTNYVAPRRRMKFISVPGRSGDICVDDGSYENVDVKYTFKLFPEISEISEPHEDMRELVRRFRNDFLIGSGGYKQLTDSYEPDTFRWAAVTSVAIEDSTGEMATVSVTFNCKPYRYYWLGEQTQRITETTVLKGVGKTGAKPLIQLLGNGSCGINIGSDLFAVTNVVGSVYIDSEAGTVRSGQTNMSQYYQTTALFPTLSSRNTISLSGDTRQINITPRWYDI